MYSQAYQDVIEDDQQTARHSERVVIENTIELMEHSEAKSTDRVLRVKALHLTFQVWSYLIDDLSSPENAMPTELKASLISVGIFVLKHLDKMRSDQQLTFQPIIEISETIKKGLK